jgi:spore coat protein CotF
MSPTDPKTTVKGMTHMQPDGQTRHAGSTQEKDMLHNILVLLKHNAREYVTATTEASCNMVRQTMQRMLNETLAEQADLYHLMSRLGMYPAGPEATRQDVRKSVQTHREAQQEALQTLRMSGMHVSRPAGVPAAGQQAWQQAAQAPGGQWRAPQPWETPPVNESRHMQNAEWRA